MTDVVLSNPIRNRIALIGDPRLLRKALPAVSLIAILIAIFVLNERAMSYRGLDLMLKYAVPIAFATIAQMFILTVNDLDLSIGAFVGLVACIAGTWLVDEPVLCILILAGCIASYAAIGALIHVRRLPSIVVTLGMSFVWLGFAVILMPTPGGAAAQPAPGAIDGNVLEDAYQALLPVGHSPAEARDRLDKASRQTLVAIR